VLARVGLLGAEGAGEEDAQHTFEFNVLQHSARELAEASYQHELPEPSSTYVNIDWKHMGVGGDNSWSRSVLSPYFVPPGMHPLCLTVPCQLLLELWTSVGFGFGAGSYRWAIRLVPLARSSMQPESSARRSSGAKRNNVPLFMGALRAEARHASRVRSLRTVAQLLVVVAFFWLVAVGLWM
jgi:hypothetical protein